jgi:hypothetical protein
MKISPGKILVYAIALFYILTASAQTTEQFSGDPLKFPVEAQDIFSTITKPSIGIIVREVMNPFLEDWQNNLYSEEEKALIISNANALISRKMMNYPDLFNYFAAVHFLDRKGNREAVSYYLQDLSLRMPRLTQRRIQAYLEQYRVLAKDNMLYKSTTFNWYSTDTSIHLEYDTAIRITYRKVNLVCATKKDTSRILNTDGVFYPNSMTWIGKRGKVTWERVGFSPDSVYAELNDYHVDVRLSDYSADTVKLINKKYFKTALYGRLLEKVQASPPGPTSTYPQFVSYLRNYEIKDLFKGIDYRGGFNVEGARVIGAGEVNENALLTINHKGKVRAQVRSVGFRILGDQISANPAALSIYTNGDSIFHPGLQLKYFDDKRQLVMYRPESGISMSPFFNGYHELDMDCGALYWQLDSDSIDFESVPSYSRISKNEFISDNFFSEYEFDRIQGIDEKNPLYIIRNYCRDYGTEEVSPEALAQYMNKSVDQTEALLLKLSILGFLYYDLVNDKAVIQDRLHEYIESNAGKKDYDVIRINSVTDKISNATLDLESYDLVIRGVEEVFLSDSQKVFIYPENDQITIKKGLDFVFSGNVSAGLFDFYAHDCSFEYDSFKLNIPLIDSLSFKVRSFTEDDRGNRPLVRVQSVLENLSGKLIIDHPSNKSGLKSFPQYPIFYSEQESFVYYDHDPLYERDSFAYYINPFTLDSLDNFSTDNLSFEGYLVSAGIFPDIGQPLKVQPDYSLGFVNHVPAEGYPAYGGKGQFFKEVNLSNRGLRGSGQLDYLTSVTLSDDFHFYPDTMITELAKKYTIEEQLAEVEYPVVKADSIYQVWYPYQDNMHLRTIRKPIEMYVEKAQLNGDLYYTPSGLTGRGNVGFESVELASELYRFKHHTIDADTLDFKLYAKGTSDLAVTAERYRTHVDFESRLVEFRTNQKGSTVNFPYNSFLCYMDNIDWYMDRQEMLLYNDLGEKYANIDEMTRAQLLKLDLSGSDFVATKPEADSLSFFSKNARYDLVTYNIDAEGVKLIRVADAAIFPDSGFVKISKGGQVQPLKNAGIVADTANMFHTIERSEVAITSRTFFKAKGTYQYHDSTKVLQEFPLDTISVDTSGRTYAVGRIKEKLNFVLNPHFDYKGNVRIASARKELFFEGGFRTHEDCYGSTVKNWVYFKSWVDPDHVKIPVQPPLVDLEGNPIDLAIQISNYDEEIYSSWFQPKAGPGDTALVAPEGEIYFDVNAGGYKVSYPDRSLSGIAFPELLFNTTRCSMVARGPLSLGLAYNYVDIGAFGDMSYLIVPDSATMKVTLAFDFLFYEGCLMAMADSIGKSANLKGIDITGKDYQSFLEYALGKTEARELRDDILNSGRIRRLPDKLMHQIVLTDVNMYWNSETNSYISRGPIGVMSLGKDPVNRYMNGHLELIRRRSGDVITLYLEVTPMQYYFFDYRNGIMQAFSSDVEFISRINETKQEKRVMSKPGLEEKYEYLVSTNRRVIDFLRRMEQLQF